MCLQYGVPVKSLVEKFAHTRFEPSGFTKNPDIPIAKSLPDYIFRWLGITFLDGFKEPAPKSIQAEHAHDAAPARKDAATLEAPARPAAARANEDSTFVNQEDAPACDSCGAITVRNGACYRCHNCGNSMGCS
jgi:ribonucleoside-diphosphate reductase alpha chain